MKETVKVIIAQIEQAFANVLRNDGTTLHEAMALDDRLSEEDVLSARSKDTEKHWSNVTRANLYDYESALSFMNPEGFRYYIPVFMIAALEGTGDEHSPFYHLTKDSPANICSKFNFSIEQATAILSFIEYLAEENDDEDQQSLQMWQHYLNIADNK